MRLPQYSAGLVLSLALTTACDDVTGLRLDPLLATDTIALAAPVGENTATPTALDIVARNGVIGGGRRPERSTDAGQWDFAVRLRQGNVVLLPAGALGLEARPEITRALDGRTFEEVTRAPARDAFLADTAVVMQQGAVYVARSRQVGSTFGACFQYAKLQPLEVDAAAGTLRLQLTTNERCGDNRLVPR